MSRAARLGIVNASNPYVLATPAGDGGGDVSDRPAVPVDAVVAPRPSAGTVTVPQPVVVGPPAVPMAQNADVQNGIAAFDQWLTQQLAAKEIPGATVALVYDQELVWSKAYGKSSIEAGRDASEDTLFHLASISKLFTTLAIGQLVERGLLSLDDKVIQHLPWFKPKSQDPADPHRGDRITIQHLLSHTSGLERDAGHGLEYWTPSVYWDRGELPSIAEIKKHFREREIVFEPGSDIKYSNLGLALVAEIVSKVSGVPFEDYVAQNIIRPLQLANTMYRLRAEQDERVAIGYLFKGADGHREATPIIRSAGGMTGAIGVSSTAKDLAALASWMFRAGDADPVLKGSTLKQLEVLQAITKTDLGEGFGTGFMRSKRNEGILVGHTGTYIGQRHAFAMDPTKKIGFVLLTNAVDTDQAGIVNKAFQTMGSAIAKAIPAVPPPPVGRPKFKAWERYLGTYKGMSKPRRVVSADVHGNLLLDGNPLSPAHGKPRSFFVSNQQYGDNKGERIIFDRAAGPNEPAPSFSFQSGGAKSRRLP
jgi:CubicO group peptidase (beta-lactamase class C family)